VDCFVASLLATTKGAAAILHTQDSISLAAFSCALSISHMRRERKRARSFSSVFRKRTFVLGLLLRFKHPGYHLKGDEPAAESEIVGMEI
jgi:hypothetical protein